MCKKISLAVFMVLFISTLFLKSQTSRSAIDVLLSGYSERMFSPGMVSDKDIDIILKCGIKAPSAVNRQPWKFTVVKDNALIGEIIKNCPPGNVLIIISGLEGEQKGISIDFDCALATENMFIAAHGLGLGARIYTGPVNNINATRKEALAIPEGYRVVSVLRIGNIDKSVDAVSAASKRKTFEEVVNYK